jgi:uncharacterized protein YkwD
VQEIYRFLKLCVCVVIVAAGVNNAFADTNGPQHKMYVPIVASGQQAQQPAPAPAPAPAQALTAQQQRVLTLVNEQRAARGLPALIANAKLNSAATNHSTDMARNDFMGHTGSNGSTLGQRVTAAGYGWSYVAENVAAGYDTADEVVTAWMNSSGHRANIMSATATEVGVGIETNAASTYGTYWTLDFGKAR